MEKSVLKEGNIMEMPTTNHHPSYQVVAGPLVIEHTDNQHLFRIMLRETVAADGYVYRQRVVSISPQHVAREAADPLAFADVLVLLADRIREEVESMTIPSERK